MLIETHRLFASLLPAMRIGVVCEVGSMDGADALRFRAAVPESTIYAFEPNPGNFRLMESNSALKHNDIHVVPLAVTNYDGEAEFFVVNTESYPDDGSRGMGSLYKRSEAWPALVAIIPVKTTRLDTFLAGKLAPSNRLALWIDTEGKAYEVIEGTTRVANQVHLVHVEVETTTYIAANQRVYSEVKKLLLHLGFVELATDRGRFSSKRNAHGQAEDRGSSEPWLAQFNAVFIRCDLSLSMLCLVKAHVLRGWFRYAVIRALRKWCPDCLSRYQDMRQRALRRKRSTQHQG
jgi:FkbM family methyltransferase